MDTIRQRRRKRWASAILGATISPLDKVRKLVALGYDEMEADHMVNGTQAGNHPVYYEQLPSPEYAEEED